MFYSKLEVSKEEGDAWFSLTCFGEGLIGQVIRREDADKIALACNAHDKLVAALKGASELLANTDGLSKNNIDNLAGEQVLTIDAALSVAGAA